jgi:L-threonylcarbamoyladenylate synthase
MLLLVRDGAVPLEGNGAYLQLRLPPLREVCKLIKMPTSPAEYAAQLYRTLHELDSQNYDWIAVDSPSPEPAWDAIRDRLKRAATSDAGSPR